MAVPRRNGKVHISPAELCKRNHKRAQKPPRDGRREGVPHRRGRRAVPSDGICSYPYVSADTPEQAKRALEKLKEDLLPAAKRSAEIAAQDNPRSKKAITEAHEAYGKAVEEVRQLIRDYLWLYEKFGDGEYADIPGLCKVADQSEIAEKGYSLTPGAYVGVAPVEDDGVDFEERMKEIHRELLSLQAESNELMETISKNLEEMGI